MPHRRSIARLMGAALLLSSSGLARAATITVNSTLDTDQAAASAVCDDGAGHCTLRAALTFANRDAAADTIQFAVTGAGVHTFSPATQLPSVTTSITIDGTTQTGYAGTPLIELNGASAGNTSTGLQVITLSGTAITFNLKGLAIYGFGSAGVFVDNATGKLSACYLGLTSSGAVSKNHVGVSVTTTATAPYTIGGSSAADRNVISGNDAGVGLDGSGVDLIGNYIGTNPAGTATAAASQNGVLVGSNTTGLTVEQNLISGNNVGLIVGKNALVQNNLIGVNAAGTAAVPNVYGMIINGTGATVQGNTISGNTTCGIDLDSSMTTNNVIAGNKIGTDVTGTAAVGNAIGVLFSGSVYGNTLGGTNVSARNIISGNTDGVSLQSSGSTGNNKIVGNWIGLDVNGAILGNTRYGVDVRSGVSNTMIGGTMGAATRNVISGNTTAGIHANSTDPTTRILGNYIGTSTDGLTARPNGIGILVDDTLDLVIGSAGNGNLISGNSGDGIQLITDPINVTIAGNTIGVSASGAALPNLRGIEIAANNSLVGGPGAGDGNQIWFNTQEGVLTNGGSLLQRNSIAHNGQLGIDVTPVGENTNMMSASLNHPLLSAASTDGSHLFVSGTPGSAGTLEFFASAACDPSGFGQGETYVGNATFNGTGTFVAMLPPVAAGQVITATSSSGGTSEFSTCATVIGCSAISVGPATLPSTDLLAPYAQTFTGSGGTAPYTFSLAGGTLPNGLTLEASGALTGMAFNVGTFQFTIAAADANGCGGAQGYQLDVYPPVDLGALPTYGDDGGVPNGDGGSGGSDGSGCGCQLGAAPTPTTGILLLSVLLTLLLRRKV